jgi:hypothetical protein
MTSKLSLVRHPAQTLVSLASDECRRDEFSAKKDNVDQRKKGGETKTKSKEKGLEQKEQNPTVVSANGCSSLCSKSEENLPFTAPFSV